MPVKFDTLSDGNAEPLGDALGVSSGDSFHDRAGAEFASRPDDAGCSNLQTWRTRALQPAYAFLFIDSVTLRLKDNGLLTTKRFHLALGILPDGTKDILAYWIDPPASIEYWSAALVELRSRGVSSIRLAVLEDCNACGPALALWFPRAIIQPSPTLFVRRAAAFVPAPERNRFLKELGKVLLAPSADEAMDAFELFAASAVAKRHRSVATYWRERRNDLSSFFELPLSTRLLVASNSATGSAVEKLRRRGLEKRNSFSSTDTAVRELILSLRDATASWHVAPNRWLPVARELASLTLRA